jgi:uncharacterized protein YndB with AHSA1/START domain
MALQTIKKEIVIQAPKEVVWQVLLNDEFTRQWYAAFSEGAHAETDWQVGSKALFTDDSGNGLIARVVENKPNEKIAMVFEGGITNGREDYESDMSKAMIGGKEEYVLSETNGATQLAVAADMDSSFADAMTIAWQKALEHLKVLAEKMHKELETAH